MLAALCSGSHDEMKELPGVRPHRTLGSFFFTIAGRTHFLMVSEQGPVFLALSVRDRSASSMPRCPSRPRLEAYRPGSLTSARLTGEHLSLDPHQGPSVGQAPAGQPLIRLTAAAHLLRLPVSRDHLAASSSHLQVLPTPRGRCHLDRAHQG